MIKVTIALEATVIEGVMMRGLDRWAFRVRETGGQISGQTNFRKAWKGRALEIPLF
jgi:uncharacterized protein YqhQ